MSNPDDFEWDGESTVIASVQATAVYTNKFGDIVIRQQDPMGHDDSTIFIPKDRAEEVAQAILNEYRSLEEG